MVRSQKNANKKASRRVVRRTRRRGPVYSSLDLKAQQYRALLLDPCNGNLVPPTAIGPSSGLLFRQRKLINLTDATWSVNATGSCAKNFAVVYRPSVGEVRVMVGHNEASASPGTGGIYSVSLEDGVLDSARAYRAVAGCVKFIPTGPIGSRAGTVSMAYVPDSLQMPGTGATTATNVINYVSSYLQLCQHTVSNASGPELPEVRWIPSDPADLEFRDKSVTYNADTGSCLLVGRQVDATGGTTTTYSPTPAIAGYLEVTTVFEWIPDYNAGVVSSVQMGSGSSLQSVLLTMGDLAKAATDNTYVRNVLMGLARRGTMAAMGLIANAVYNSQPGPALLRP
jgi:hypothetical protein